MTFLILTYKVINSYVDFSLILRVIVGIISKKFSIEVNGVLSLQLRIKYVPREYSLF